MHANIAYTPGEPAGIGTDLIIRYAQTNNCTPLTVFADPNHLLERARELSLPIELTKQEGALPERTLRIHPINTPEPARAGKPTTRLRSFVLQTLDAATQSCLQKKSSALLTGPVDKGILSTPTQHFSGHTEYLQDKTKSKTTVMVLATKGLQVALATTHLPLKDVPRAITQESLTKTLKTLTEGLQREGISSPKIRVLGLNPHAGENGNLGIEEQTIITPVIKKLANNGCNLEGPVSADTAFLDREGVDAFLAMYHNQGLPVIKTLGFHHTINITYGLPFARASVDHGTAYQLATTQHVNTESFSLALSYLLEKSK